MIALSNKKLKAIISGPVTKPRPDELLQESLGGDPWKVAVASMLLCRTRRRQAETALQKLLFRWPGPEYLCRADIVDVQSVVRSCGFYANRARQLIRFSSLYLGDAWEDLRDLPGVSLYVADAVGLVCFGCSELESTDAALCARSSQIGVSL